MQPALGRSPLADPFVDLALPEGARLIHVGAYKTGSTAIQAAMWAARQEMLAQGVRLAGRSHNPAAAVRAVTGRPSPFGDDGAAPPIRRWHELASEIRRADERHVVVSSEFFSWADAAVIRRIMADLQSTEVNVAVTLRPLAKILPSMWQQNVQTGMTESLDAWLRGVLSQPPEQANRAFWTLHRHDELAARWAAAVGPQRVTAVVLDEGDHEFLLRTFEGLLGLGHGTLEPQRGWANRSLTLPEIEAIRAFNEAFQAEGLPKGLHARLMRYGAAELMKRRTPDPSEPKVGLPGWAIEPTLAVQQQIVEQLSGSGIRVIGDLARLAERPVAATEWADDDVGVPPRIAAAMALGVVIASGEARRARSFGRRFQLAEPVEVTRVPTYQLAGTLVLRGVRAAARGVDRARMALARRGGQRAPD